MENKTNKVLRDYDAVLYAVKVIHDDITRRSGNLDYLENEIAELTQAAEQERLTIADLETVRMRLNGFSA